MVLLVSAFLTSCWLCPVSFPATPLQGEQHHQCQARSSQGFDDRGDPLVEIRHAHRVVTGGGVPPVPWPKSGMAQIRRNKERRSTSNPRRYKGWTQGDRSKIELVRVRICRISSLQYEERDLSFRISNGEVAESGLRHTTRNRA